MESSPSKTEGSVVRVPPTEAGTLSYSQLIMKIRLDLARALQGLPGAPLPVPCPPIVLRSKGPVEDQSQEVGFKEGTVINNAREELCVNTGDGKEEVTNN